jgi:hypothetical protein
MSHGAIFVSVILIDESISEHSECFVYPEVDESVFVGNVYQVHDEHTLDDFGEISQVESVMAFCWSWQEVIDSLQIKLDRALDDWLSEDV